MIDPEDWVLRKAPPLETTNDEETSKIMSFESTIEYPTLSSDFEFISTLVKETEKITLTKLAERIEDMLSNENDVLSIHRKNIDDVDYVVTNFYGRSQNIYDFLGISNPLSVEEEDEEEEIEEPVRQAGFYQDAKGRLFKSDGFDWLGDTPAEESSLEFLG
jgi:hypothetical protein